MIYIPAGIIRTRMTDTAREIQKKKKIKKYYRASADDATAAVAMKRSGQKKNKKNSDVDNLFRFVILHTHTRSKHYNTINIVML